MAMRSGMQHKKRSKRECRLPLGSANAGTPSWPSFHLRRFWIRQPDVRRDGEAISIRLLHPLSPAANANRQSLGDRSTPDALIDVDLIEGRRISRLNSAPSDARNVARDTALSLGNLSCKLFGSLSNLVLLFGPVELKARI